MIGIDMPIRFLSCSPFHCDFGQRRISCPPLCLLRACAFNPACCGCASLSTVAQPEDTQVKVVLELRLVQSAFPKFSEDLDLVSNSPSLTPNMQAQKMALLS